MPAATEPERDCPLCPRLAAFRIESRLRSPGWHNGPVNPFGSIDARLLVVGLAPGLKGANRTGRPFTGDYAGVLLYGTLKDHGFAEGIYGGRADDGFTLLDCRVTNAARCVPPENKPTPAEIANCRPFLEAEIAAMPRLAAYLALGSVAHATLIAALGLQQSAWRFAHGRRHSLPDGRLLADSYHCSRYNTNTGRLTEAMFREVVAGLRDHLATHA